MPNTSLSVLDSAGSAVKLAQVSISESAETRLISRVHLNDSGGNSISPATETSLTSLLAKFGAVVNGAAPVSVISRSNNAFLAAAHVIPGTLTTGTYYFSLHNNDAAVQAKLTRLRITCNFTGTAAATRSLMDIMFISGATPSSGTAITALKKASTNSSPSVDAMSSTSGITISGAAETLLRSISQMSQLTSQQVIDIDMTGTPLVLNNGEGIAFKANGSIVSGFAFSVDASWEENAV